MSFRHSRECNALLMVIAGLIALVATFVGLIGGGFCGWNRHCLFVTWPILMLPTYLLTCFFPFVGRPMLWVVAIGSLLVGMHGVLQGAMVLAALICQFTAFRRDDKLHG